MADGQDQKGLVPAVFFDRDGVLNRDSGYVHKPEDLDLFSEVPSALRALRDLGFRLIVISNQSGIGRGLFSHADTDRFHEAMQRELREAASVEIDGFYYCPHQPEDQCQCRKPQTALVEQAIKEHGIDRSQSWFIGDRDSDVACGHNARLLSVFLDRTGRMEASDACAQDLSAFLSLVKKKSKPPRPDLLDLNC